jgi:ankyrin repeat protein
MQKEVYTALRFRLAIAREHRIIALFLLDHGADVNIQGGVHENALQAAHDRSDCLMIKLLLLSGARATNPRYPNITRFPNLTPES